MVEASYRPAVGSRQPMVGDQKDFVLVLVPTSTNFPGYTDGAELQVQSKLVSQALLCCRTLYN